MTGYLLATFTALLWGAGFIGSRYGLESLGAMSVTFARFAIALVVCLPTILWIRKTSLTLSLIGKIFVCALALAGIMFFQIKGLQYTTVAKSGFITILYVFFTPILSYILFKTKISSTYWSLLLFAFSGILLLLDLDITNFNIGDFYTLICALCSAIHLITVEKFSKQVNNILLFNILQLTFVCLITLPLAVGIDGFSGFSELLVNFDSNKKAISGLLFMGIFSTAIAFLIQIKAQQTIAPHKASLVFLLESPFAAILGYSYFNEVISYQGSIGCMIVLLAVALIPFELEIARYYVLKSTKLKYIFVKQAHAIGSLLR